MSFRLGKRSLRNMRGIHPDLSRVVKRAIAISDQDFTVIEGLRTLARQKELKRKGFSKTLRSRHITGHAVDIVPYPIAHRLDYPDSMWNEVSRAMKQAAKDLNVDLGWGPDMWNGWDKPHYQLQRKSYPA